jgi:hypothetical protein
MKLNFPAQELECVLIWRISGSNFEWEIQNFEILSNFSQFLESNADYDLEIGHGRFLPHSSQFAIYNRTVISHSKIMNNIDDMMLLTKQKFCELGTSETSLRNNTGAEVA